MERLANEAAGACTTIGVLAKESTPEYGLQFAPIILAAITEAVKANLEMVTAQRDALARVARHILFRMDVEARTTEVFLAATHREDLRKALEGIPQTED